jgi:hypothetical protein
VESGVFLWEEKYIEFGGYFWFLRNVSSLPSCFFHPPGVEKDLTGGEKDGVWRSSNLEDNY